MQKTARNNTYRKTESNVCNVENRDFSQNDKGKIFQMAHFLSKLRKAKKIGNASRIIASYHKFVLCKKPHEKKNIKREIAIYPRVSKIALFAKKPRGDQREIF